MARQQLTTWVGLAEQETETQRWLWTIAMVGETPSLIREFLEKCTRDKQASCTVPSLAPPGQAVTSKEGCPTLVNT